MRPCARACRSVLRIRTPLVQSGHAFATLHVAVCHLLLSLSLSLYTRAHKYNCKHTNTPTPPHPDTHPGKLADRQSAHSTDRHAPSTRAPSHHRETERETDRDREGQRNREGECATHPVHGRQATTERQRGKQTETERDRETERERECATHPVHGRQATTHTRAIGRVNPRRTRQRHLCPEGFNMTVSPFPPDIALPPELPRPR